MSGRRVFVRYSDAALVDVIDLVNRFGGYFDGDLECVVLPFNEELVEEMESRGIRFKVEVVE